LARDPAAEPLGSRLPIYPFRVKVTFANLRSVLHRLRGDRPWVRPWAIFAPIVVFVVALPLLRPLRSPDPQWISDSELSCLETVQSLVEQHTFAIDQSAFRATSDRIRIGEHLYSDQAPMLAVLLSGAYAVMHWGGMTFAKDATWVTFLLTLVGATLPVALAAGLVYKMGRLFELRRPWRCGLALVVVLGSGLISYSTTLNPHAPAAALLLAAVASLFNVTLMSEKARITPWLALSGFCAALSACIDPAAVIFLPLLAVVICACRWPRMVRIAGIGAYLAGAVLPLLVSVALVRPITGDIRPGFMHPELSAPLPLYTTSGRVLSGRAEPGQASAASRISSPTIDDDADQSHSVWKSSWDAIVGIGQAFFGGHGVLIHFPVIIFGIAGTTMVMHRHWPMTTKMLAAATLAGAATVILAISWNRPDWSSWTGAMFATSWFVVFMPLVLFWAGVWLRRPHGRVAWTVAAVLLTFSVMVSLLGATGPMPREGFDQFTATGALMNLIHPPAAGGTEGPDAAMLAQR
jgi:hypothetical protein